MSPFIPPAEKTAKHANTCAVKTHVNYIVALAAKFIATPSLASGSAVSLKGGFLCHAFYDVNVFKLFP